MIAVGGAAIAFYDGAIGPGTGTFLVLAFTSIIGADFVHGSAMAKLVNTGTNLGALAVCGHFGHIDWALGAILAACTIAGGLTPLASRGGRTPLGPQHSAYVVLGR